MVQTVYPCRARNYHRPMNLYRNALLLAVALMLAPWTAVNAGTLALPERNETVSLAEIESICRHYGLDALWAHIEADPPELPFRSDGCSVWPDTWLSGRDLYEGCFIHDLFYWSGTPGDRMGRLHADIWLMLWVAEHASIELAEAMFNGVRVGGGELIETPWRWGFGRTAGDDKTAEGNADTRR